MTGGGGGYFIRLEIGKNGTFLQNTNFETLLFLNF